MTDRDSFIKTICQSPKDDTVRLVFADWLQENGEEDYGEFIRVQCELARMPMFVGECKVCSATPDEEGWIRHSRGCYTQSEDGGGDEAADRNPKWEALRRRERELIGYDFCRWADRFPKITGHYHRGFISFIVYTTEDWLAHADSLYWQPSRTVVCPECCGQASDGDYAPPLTCRCESYGRIPRPFVPTVQPLEKVTLTTFPTVTYIDSDMQLPCLVANDRLYADIDEMLAAGHLGPNEPYGLGILRRHWPHIEFTLTIEALL